jgi:hypothetical protein
VAPSKRWQVLIKKKKMKNKDCFLKWNKN